MNVAVLASHEGTTLQAILDACGGGMLDARVVIVISNNADSGAIRRARAADVAHAHLSGRTHPDAEALDRTILGAVDGVATDVILLAGYMKKLGALTLGRYAGRVFNTHPALLPKYGGKGMYGMNVHRAVLAADTPNHSPGGVRRIVHYGFPAWARNLMPQPRLFVSASFGAWPAATAARASPR